MRLNSKHYIERELKGHHKNKAIVVFSVTDKSLLHNMQESIMCQWKAIAQCVKRVNNIG